jgi:hypothetical protein
VRKDELREDEAPTDIPLLLPSKESVREDEPPSRTLHTRVQHILDTRSKKREGGSEKDK